MELFDIVRNGCKRIINAITTGPDGKAKTVYEVASGMVLLNAEQTNQALYRVGKTNYLELIPIIQKLLVEHAEFNEIKRLTPVIGRDKAEKHVVYVVLAK